MRFSDKDSAKSFRKALEARSKAQRTLRRFGGAGLAAKLYGPAEKPKKAKKRASLRAVSFLSSDIAISTRRRHESVRVSIFRMRRRFSGLGAAHRTALIPRKHGRGAPVVADILSGIELLALVAWMNAGGKPSLKQLTGRRASR